MILVFGLRFEIMSGVITLKFTSLLIRTISKPVANMIKSQSRQSPFLKTNFIRFGQFVNKVDMRLRNNANVKVRPLNDNKAIELGSNFLSELFVFSIAAGLIMYESFRPKSVKPVAVTSDQKEANGEVKEANGEVKSEATSEGGEKGQGESRGESTVQQNGDISMTIDRLVKEVNDLKSQNLLILSELGKLKPEDKHIHSHVNSHSTSKIDK